MWDYELVRVMDLNPLDVIVYDDFSTIAPVTINSIKLDEYIATIDLTTSDNVNKVRSVSSYIRVLRLNDSTTNAKRIRITALNGTEIIYVNRQLHDLANQPLKTYSLFVPSTVWLLENKHKTPDNLSWVF